MAIIVKQRGRLTLNACIQRLLRPLAPPMMYRKSGVSTKGTCSLFMPRKCLVLPRICPKSMWNRFPARSGRQRPSVSTSDWWLLLAERVLTMGGDHDVVIVPVSDAQHVRSHAVTSAGLDESLHGCVVLQATATVIFSASVQKMVQLSPSVITTPPVCEDNQRWAAAPLQTHYSFRRAFGPEPLVQSIISEGSCGASNAPLNGSNGYCIPHNFNHS